MARSGVLVVGSANMDLVASANRFPRSGETIFGSGFGMFPGGKGANQAVCCAKLGGRTYFVGRMGSDIFGESLARNMKRCGVNLRYLLALRKAATGVALITVDSTGQNQIIVVSGSNMDFQPEDIERARRVFPTTNVTLLQLEIPLRTVVHSARLAKRHAHTVVLNPAPARPLPVSLLRLVDFLIPNTLEAAALTGISAETNGGARRAGRELVALGAKHVIITLGNKGCLLMGDTESTFFPARKVKVVDTTAAGDAFAGAFALSLSRGKGVHEAIRFAIDVAAYSVTRMGAQSSMPTVRDLRRFLARAVA